MAKNKNMLSVVVLLAVTAAFALLGAGQAFAFCSVCTEDTLLVVQPTGTFELAAGTVVPIEVLIDPSTVSVALDTTDPIPIYFPVSFVIRNSSGGSGGANSFGQLFNVTPVNMSQSRWRANWTLTPETINAGNVTGGTHSVNITVLFKKSGVGSLFDSDSSIFTLTAPDTTAPTANAGPDQTVNEDTLVTFDGSASSDNVGVASYTWSFTDGTAQSLSGVSPTYTFATPDVYLVTLTVEDAAGNTATDTVTITVNDITPPSVGVLYPPQGFFVLGLSGIDFYAKVTDNVGLSSVIATLTSPSGAITGQQTAVFAVDRYWAVFSTNSSNFPELGTYVVRFIATDTSANINASETNTVTFASPIDVQNVSANPSTIEQGETTTISANVSTEPDDLLDSVRANFTSPSGASRWDTMVGASSVGFSTDFATDSTTEVGVWTVVVVSSTSLEAGGLAANYTGLGHIAFNSTESTTFTVTAAAPVINLTNQTNGTVMLNETNTTLNCDESTISNLSIVGANGIQVNNCILAGSPQLLVQNSVGSMNNLVVSTPGMSITIENGTLTLTNVAFGDGSGAQVLFPTATLTGTVAVNDSLLSVTPTSASLDSAAVPGLNTSATLTFPNVPFGNPRVVFNDGNGSANQVCEAPRCQNFSFANGVVNFTVTQWSEYIVEETPNNDNGGNNDGGSGGGGGGTRYVPTVAPTAVASGPTCAELAQALSCGTGSVATCSFPSSTTDRPFCKALVSAGTEVERPAGQAAASTQTAPAQNDQASFGNAIISDNALTGAAAARVPGGSKTLLGAGAVVAVLGILLGIATALRRR